MDKNFKLIFTIGSGDQGKSIKEFLKEQEISKAALTDIKFSGGKILINNVEMNVRYVLNAGDILKLIFPLEVPSEGLKPECIPLDIVFEDEFVLVVAKPAYMNTIPSREHPTGSLANALLGYYLEKGINASTHIVTRLDRNTSGLVLIAKHRHIHHLLSKQQKNHLIKRTYEAFVHGNLKMESGIIEEAIGRKADSIIEREVTENGQYACTHYKLLNRYRSFDYIQLRLETGRTHQIRVHMSFIGHPLLGDSLYGGKKELISRQALHCKSLCLLHPITKETLSFELPLTYDMESILNRKG